LWTVPSGFLEAGESLQEGATRETREETGVHLAPDNLDLYSITSLPNIEQVLVTFRTELTEPSRLQASAECMEVGFFSAQQIQQMNIAWERSPGEWTGHLFQQLITRRFAIHLITRGGGAGGANTSRQYSLMQGISRS
jgi:ADP-ribose pyrophosphatase YjhB (NUDIX family)